MFSQFIDQGLIQLDAPISSVFADYPRDDPHVPTFRQCFNHTAGLSGQSDFGGMRNPNLENIILNAIDVIEPGQAHAYSGMGYELAAKAMELVCGKSAVQLYHDHMFEPLGFGDVVLGNASSDCELTAMELATLGQWIANRGSYGDREYISAKTFEELLPKPLNVPGSADDYGLGLQWARHRKPDAAADSRKPDDFLFSPNTVCHGSFSGCIMLVDLDQQLVIVQVRQKFSDQDNDWWKRFFQTVAAAIATP
jgi:CubicO group peptidase (beta-lactamase class C family)